MKKHGDDLFQIGEVAKILGATRKALLEPVFITGGCRIGEGFSR